MMNMHKNTNFHSASMNMWVPKNWTQVYGQTLDYRKQTKTNNWVTHLKVLKPMEYFQQVIGTCTYTT